MTKIFFCFIIFSFPVLSNATGEAVNHLLQNVAFRLENITVIENPTVEADISNIRCGGLSLTDLVIKSKIISTGVSNIDLVIDGFVVDCRMYLDLKRPMRVTGNVQATGSSSEVHLKVGIVTNCLGVPVRASMGTEGCSVPMRFTVRIAEGLIGGGTVRRILENRLSSILSAKVGTMMCQGREGAFGGVIALVENNLTRAMTSLATQLNPMLNDSDTPFLLDPPNLPDGLEFFSSAQKLKLIDHNINMVVEGRPFVAKLVDRLFANGRISKSDKFIYDDLFFNLTVNISGLDSFSEFEVLQPVRDLDSGYEHSKYSLYFNVSLDNLHIALVGRVRNTTSNDVFEFVVNSTAAEVYGRIVFEVGMERKLLPCIDLACLQTVCDNGTVQLFDFSIDNFVSPQVYSDNGLELGDEMIMLIHALYAPAVLRLFHVVPGATDLNNQKPPPLKSPCDEHNTTEPTKHPTDRPTFKPTKHPTDRPTFKPTVVELSELVQIAEWVTISSVIIGLSFGILWMLFWRKQKRRSVRNGQYSRTFLEDTS